MARDHFHDECGVFGVHGHSEASNITYLGLYALQHRGQESAGIVTSSNGREHHVHRAMGLVADVFGEKTLQKLPGRTPSATCATRRPASSQLRNAQPFCATTDGGPGGDRPQRQPRERPRHPKELEGRGAIFSTTADSEVIVQLLARSREAPWRSA